MITVRQRRHARGPPGGWPRVPAVPGARGSLAPRGLGRQGNATAFNLPCRCVRLMRPSPQTHTHATHTCVYSCDSDCETGSCFCVLARDRAQVRCGRPSDGPGTGCWFVSAGADSEAGRSSLAPRRALRVTVYCQWASNGPAQQAPPDGGRPGEHAAASGDVPQGKMTGTRIRVRRQGVSP
jgi:hypothetical protein